jgi:hypothetical protein
MRYLIHYLKVALMFVRDGLIALAFVAFLTALSGGSFYLFDYLCRLAGLNSGLVAISLAVAGYFVVYVRQHPVPEIT